ncbi:MAG TPA: hypothetical protein VFV49_09440 [Thermoanaerobaculia bacterium]|nr:hypothetical protein [Thermoanaerobaculia bacterium]
MMRTNETERRFRVAFSYARENRDLVGRAATLIAGLFGETAVLYDKFHEGEFARDDLASHLPRLYQEESGLIVVVICPDYRTKEWTGLEWDAIREVIRTRQEREKNEVMLCRFDGVTPEGLDPEPGPGFVELDKKTRPGQFAKVILQRLAANEKRNATTISIGCTCAGPGTGSRSALSYRCWLWLCIRYRCGPGRSCCRLCSWARWVSS